MALEHVIRSLQARTHEGDASPQRRETLRGLGQHVRRRLVEATDLDPHAETVGARPRA